MPENVLTVRFEDDDSDHDMRAAPSSARSSGTVSSANNQLGGAVREAHDPVEKSGRRLEETQRQSMTSMAARTAINTTGGMVGGTLGRMGMLAGRAAMAMGPAGAIIAGTAAALAGGFVAAHVATSNLADKHSNLGFSPDVAMAKAQSEVSRTQRDIRESQVLGPSLGKFMEAQTKISEVIADLLLPIKEFVVNVAASVLQAIAEMMTVIRDVMIELGHLAKPQPAMDMVDDFFRIGGAGGAAAFGLDGIGGAPAWKAHPAAAAIANDFFKNPINFWAKILPGF
jgi:hypothetical protein